MIVPEKHLDLNHSVLRVAAHLLKLLKRKRVIKMDEGIASVTRRMGAESNPAILPALNLLFLLGKTDYLPATDSLEYID